MTKITDMTTKEKRYAAEADEALKFPEMAILSGLETPSEAREHFKRVGEQVAESEGVDSEHASLIIEEVLKHFDAWCKAREGDSNVEPLSALG